MTRIIGLYRSAALFSANCLVALLGLNLAALCVLWMIGPIARLEPVEVLLRDYPEILSAAYPDMSREEIRHLLDETWTRPYVYEPFTQFRERAGSGRFVNVHVAGFRHVRSQGDWPVDTDRFNIFLFGGPTLFNYGLPDERTIAAVLQSDLRATHPETAVYNFGCGGYFSTQERLLFEKLLAAGQRPSLAVFFDGLNEFYYHDNRPQFTVELTDFFQRRDSTARPPILPEVFTRTPMARLFRRMSGEFQPVISESLRPVVLTGEQLQATYDRSEVLERALDTYIWNKRLIEAVADMEGIPVLFFWQPVPTFSFSSEGYPFTNGQLGRHNFSRFGYPLAERAWRAGRFGEGFHWMADIQARVEAPVYLDLVHYAAGASEVIGREMACTIRRSHLAGP